MRKDHGAVNFATLRHLAPPCATLRRLALNLLKQEQTLKVGFKNKRLRTGWDHDSLLTVPQPLFQSP